ncbi:hypothetical protein FRB98_006561 [Tulasnella sp. 332]|nr:hypothetical protein FRB98_006561 [Tulasnella sp. 332]
MNPASIYNSPSGIQIQVSLTFSPNTVLPGSLGGPVDIIIRTSDFVFFYANQAVLRARSSNGFGHLLLGSELAQSPGPSGSRTMFSGASMDMPALSGSASPMGSQSDQHTLYPSFHPSAPMSPDPAYKTSRRQSEPPSRKPLLSIAVEEQSAVFNIVMHITYELACNKYGPDLNTLSQGLRCLWKYGIPVPGMDADVWTILLHHSQTQPLWAYATAAQHGMDSVCVPASRNTLAVSLSTLGEAEAQLMGAIYLRRLFFLHVGRRIARSYALPWISSSSSSLTSRLSKPTVQRVIITPPQTHPPTQTCSPDKQTAISNAWAIAVADVVTRPLAPGASVATLLEAFRPLELTACDICKGNIRTRLSEIVQHWLNIKSTI